MAGFEEKISKHLDPDLAHFQAYVLTLPNHNFAALAIESDNLTISRIHDFYVLVLSKLIKGSWGFSMFTARNFVYKDEIGEPRFYDYINKMVAKGFKSAGQEKVIPFAQHHTPEAEAREVDDVRLPYAKQTQETPILTSTLTKTKLLSYVNKVHV